MMQAAAQRLRNVTIICDCDWRSIRFVCFFRSFQLKLNPLRIIRAGSSVQRVPLKHHYRELYV